MDSTLLPTIAAYLRGLTFDGHAGAVVTRLDAEPVGVPDGATLVIDILPEDSADRLQERISTAYEHHGKMSQEVPRSADIRLPDGSSAFFGIGSSIDQARTPSSGPGRKRATVSEQEHAGSSLFLRRSDVMRGRISVVTGGAQGFGEGIVRSLVAGGSIVCIVDLNREGAKALAEELNREQGHTVAIPFGANVADEDSVRSMVESIVLELGGFDLFISNAGVLKAGPVTELSLKDFNFVTSVNYVGFFICSKHIAPILAIQNRAAGGRYFSDIIQINSKSGLEGSNKNGAYAGSKFGGIGLVQSFALELVTDNIKVNAVCPGNFFEGPLWADPDRGLFVQYLNAGKVPGAKTIADVKSFYEKKVPMGRGCRPADVVRAICSIVEQEYETGQAVPVTGGQVMLN